MMNEVVALLIETFLATHQMDIRLQPNMRPRLKASRTLLALGTSLLSNCARHNSQELDLETGPATSVMEACPMPIASGLIQVAAQV